MLSLAGMNVNQTFQEAVNHVARTWPDDHQQIVGEAILDGTVSPTAKLPVIQLSVEERGLIDQALEDVSAGRVLSHSQVQEMFARHDA